MEIGVVGVGRLGRELARRIAEYHNLTIFDVDAQRRERISSQYGAKQAESMLELANLDAVILAVPDRAVVSCIEAFQTVSAKAVLINVATNISQHLLQRSAKGRVSCISVKFVSQATEMSCGQSPLLIINDQPSELVPLVQEVFRSVGEQIVGRADMVAAINSIAAEAALVAAVCIEEKLHRQKIHDALIIKNAIRQVAAGVLKAYADNDLGPFAQDVAKTVRCKLRQEWLTTEEKTVCE